MVEIYAEQIKRLEVRVAGDEEEDVAEEEKELTKTQVLDEAINAIEDLEKFYETEKVKKEWGKPSQPTIGYIDSSPPSVAFDVGPKASRRTGARSRSTIPSPRTCSRAISSILVCFKFSYSRSSSLMVTLRYGDPIRLVHLEDVSPRRRQDDFQVPRRSSPSTPRHDHRRAHALAQYARS